MTAINQLSAVDTVEAGDLVPVFSQENGDSRKAPLSVIAAFMQSSITGADNKITQYVAPSATGFTATVTGGASVWLILTPSAGFADGTITLPDVADCTDKQELLVNTTQAVTTLAINGNGAAVVGAPATLAANDAFRLRFDGVLDTWYRVSS